MTREQVYGRRAVREALRGRREVLELWAGERAQQSESWLRDVERPRVQTKLERDLSEAAGTRDHQGVVEAQLLAIPAASWAEAAAKARYVLNLYASELAATDTHHRDLVATVLADFARLSGES